MSKPITPLFPNEKLLLGPGPCNVSPRVRSAMNQPLLGHLDADFIGIMEECKTHLREVFRTENEITFPVSGTGSAGMEFCLVNWIEPGDRVLVGVNGVFGTRLANLADRLGADTTRLEFEWGAPVDKEVLAARADELKPKLICVVNGETSTGVYQNMDGIGEIARDCGALLLVDCVTSLAGMPVELDIWGADLVYSGTQKCLASPPGLSPVSVSPRALERFRARKNPVPSFYLDLGEILKYVGSGNAARAYHHTAPISNLFALHQSLCEVLEEGLEKRIARHREAAEYLIAKMSALGLEPIVEQSARLHPLTTLRAPEGVEEAKVRTQLMQKHHIEIGAGLGPFAGKIWRIGLMGHNANKTTVEVLAACLGDVLTT